MVFVRLFLSVFIGLGFSTEARADRPHLILISMDTTRADALSCYGTPPEIQHAIPKVTPVLDEMAASGVRFKHFYTHAPTTLNSHTSMLTGLDPHAHQVPRNGFRFQGRHQTLAERLRNEGYQTVAVVAAAALEKEMGLDAGFDVYDDRFSVKYKSMYQDTAERVVRRVFQQLDGRDASKPLFLFVHFYDPHGPLTPRADYRMRFVDPDATSPLMTQPWTRNAYMTRVERGEATDEDRALGASLYLAEVSYMDHYIGELFAGLQSRGFLDKSLVAITADHGQHLSNNGKLAFSHGYDVREKVMHIPLIIRGYGLPIPRGRVVNRRFGMAGLAPTLLKALGQSGPLGRGRDFFAALRPGPVWDTEGWPSRPQWPIVMEATRPYTNVATDHWNNLDNHRALRLGAFKLYRMPKHASEPERFSEDTPMIMQEIMRQLLTNWDAKAPSARLNEMEEKTREALEALGYVESSSE